MPLVTEAQMRGAVAETPEEQNEAYRRTQNLQELNAELARTKNPDARAVLEAERQKLQRPNRQARLADGRVLEFPSDTTDAVIQATVKRVLAQQPAKGAVRRAVEAADEATQRPLTETPGYEYGTFLPYRKPIGGGKTEFAMPSVVREGINALTAPGRALESRLSIDESGNITSSSPGIEEALGVASFGAMGMRPPGRLLGAKPAPVTRQEPKVGELPEPPQPEFTMKGEAPEVANVREFPDISAGTSRVTVEELDAIERALPVEGEVGEKAGSLERAKAEIRAGSNRPVEITIGPNGPVITDGRHLLQAAKELGVKDVPVRVVGGTVEDVFPRAGGRGIEPILSLKDDLDDVYGAVGEKAEPPGIVKPRVKLHAGMTPEEQVAAQEQAMTAAARNVDVPPGAIKPQIDIEGVARITDEQMKAAKAPPASAVKDAVDLVAKNGAIRRKIAASTLVTKVYRPKSFTEFPRFNDSRIDDMPPMVIGDKDIGEWAFAGRVLRSPHNVFSKYMGYNSNPAVDAVIKTMDMGVNIQQAKRWSNVLFKGVSSSRAEVEGVMKPFSERYATLLKEAQDKGWIDEYQHLADQVKANPRDLRVLTQLQNHPMNGLFRNMAQIQAEAMEALIPVARQSASVRIALLAESKLPPSVPYSADELQRAQAIAQMMKVYKGRLDKVGIPTRTDYQINHLYDPMQTIGKQFHLNEQTIDKSMFFPHRLGDFNWMPDAVTLVNTYLPSTEYRIATQAVLQKYRSSVIQDIGRTQPMLAKGLDRYLKDNLQGDDSPLHRLANEMISWVYIKDLAFSPSVAVKHALKTAATVSRQGFVPSLTAATENFVSLGGQALFRLGIKSEEPVATQLKRSFDLSAKSALRAIDSNPELKDGMLAAARALTGYPTLAVERFENGITVLAEAMKGVNKGVPDEVIRREIVNSILETNFRGQWDQPTAHKNILGRVATMFQTTPLKISENVYNVAKGGVKGERQVAMSYNPEAGLFKPEYEKSRRAELIRFVILLGSVETVSRLNDTSNIQWMLDPPYLGHLIEPSAKAPFFRISRFGEEHVGENPALSELGKGSGMVRRLTGGSIEGAGQKLSSDLGTYSKLRNIWTGHIPWQYGKHHPIRYLLGLPSLEASDKAALYGDIQERKKELLKR